jgi:hypothetical protein
MMQLWTPTGARRWTALTVAAGLLLPVVAGCGHQSADSTTSGGGGSAPPPATAPAPPHQGMTGKQKLVLLAGAALLYYIYRRDVANNNKPAATGPSGKPQLYREEKGPNKGAIYYRDPKNPQDVIWVTAPKPVEVPADQVQQYAPDYQQYQNQPVPPVPTGATTVPATQYDPSLSSTSGPPGPGG